MLLDAPAPPPCGNSASSVTATITPRTTAAPTPSPTANRALRLRAPRGPVKGPEMVLAAAWVILRGWEGRAAPCRPGAVRGWPGTPDAPAAHRGPGCGEARRGERGPEMVLAAAWVILRGWEGRAAPCRPAAVRGWPGSPDAPAAHRGPVCGDARPGEEVGGEKPCWTRPARIASIDEGATCPAGRSGRCAPGAPSGIGGMVSTRSSGAPSACVRG